MEKHIPTKRAFFLRYLLRGFIWLGLIILVFILVKKYASGTIIDRIDVLAENETLIFGIFLLSEILIGIIPPEVFFIWALRYEHLSGYYTIIFLLSVISYLAGVAGYYIGRYLNTTLFFRLLRRRFLSKSQNLLNIYGLYLIIVASITPLPFSGVSMLVGTSDYPVRKYLFYSLARFLRFAIGSWFIWEANLLG